jgi:hypothetical protein
VVFHLATVVAVFSLGLVLEQGLEQGLEQVGQQV